MARLIDADKITDKVILDYLGAAYASCRPDIREMLDDQPTVNVIKPMCKNYTTKMNKEDNI